MNPGWLTLRDLEYVVAVARLGHFGKAAATCHVSQPALSAQIKKLEERLGTPLFDRDNRSVSITAAGQRVVAQAQVVLDEAQKLIAEADPARPPLSGPFRLGAIATLGPYLLPGLLAPLKKGFPGMDLTLREGLTDGLLAELKRGHLDAVLASRTFDTTGLAVFPLFREPLVVMLPKGHSLCAKPRLSTADLDGGDMVLLEDGHCLRDEALEACRPNRRRNVQDFHATSLETLRYLVANGAGYTLMPVLAVRKEPGALVEYRRLQQEGAYRTIVLTCRERFAQKGEVRALAEFLRRHPPRCPLPDLDVVPTPEERA